MDKEALNKAFDELELEPVGHGGRPMTLNECMEAEGPPDEPDDVSQWKALPENEYKQRKFLQAIAKGVTRLAGAWMAVLPALAACCVSVGQGCAHRPCSKA